MHERPESENQRISESQNPEAEAEPGPAEIVRYLDPVGVVRKLHGLGAELQGLDRLMRSRRYSTPRSCCGTRGS
jgi:hypothetical protein